MFVVRTYVRMFVVAIVCGKNTYQAKWNIVYKNHVGTDGENMSGKHVFGNYVTYYYNLNNYYNYKIMRIMVLSYWLRLQYSIIDIRPRRDDTLLVGINYCLIL